jgi:hypothetical protein
VVRIIRFTTLLGIVMLGAGFSSAADIPVDHNGLPLWEIREFNDFPIRLALDQTEDLTNLLALVPIASFHREQITHVYDTPDSFHIIFEPRVTSSEARALQAAGYHFERLPDQERQVRKEMEDTWAAQAAAGGDLLHYGKQGVYHTHAQIGAILEQVAADHPDIAIDSIWGYSVLGRELWGITISDNVTIEEPEPEVRLTSTMHGDEPPGMEMLLYLVDYLTNNYNRPGFEDVTNLVDNYEIHILPLHNPDGYILHQRRNVNNIDLNRNFPVPDGTIGDDYTWVEEVETVAVKTDGNRHHYVISANAHTGALVVNYPWDYTYDLTPDDAAIIQLSLEYSTYNLPMYYGSWPQGITNGAQWYVTRGCLQDWSYHETGCIDVTLELSNSHWPPASLLDDLWDDNRESYMHYIKAARYGVNGVVTASDSGLPLAATVTVVGNSKSVVTDPDHGDYYKLLATGTYDIVFTADGHVSQTVYGVTTTWGTPTVLDVALAPLPTGVVAGHVRNTGGVGLDATVEVRTYPGDEYVTSVLSDSGNDGYYTVSLLYGEYNLIASSPGYGSEEQTATVSATPVDLDFTLGSTEEVALFSDDFENGTSQWLGGWDLASPPQGHDSANSLTDSPAGNYPSYADSPCAMNDAVDLSNCLEGTVSFWAKWEIESDWDACWFQVSTDGGNSWSSLATQHTVPASGQGVQVPAGQPLFEGTQVTWVQNSVDLVLWLGMSDVRFRFHLRSDSSTNRDGFYFDDFVIQVTRQVVSDTTPTPELKTRFLTAYPNPFNPQTTLRYETGRSGPVRIEIYDLQGRWLRTLLDETLPAGVYATVWDGRTHAGATAPSGVYFGRLVSRNENHTIKLMLVK